MNVPRLRFSKYNEEWNKIDLSNIFSYFSTNSFSREQLDFNGVIKNLHYGDIHKKFGALVDVSNDINTFIKDQNFNNKYELCKENDLIIADASEDYEGIGKATEVININDNKIVSGLHTIMARDTKNIFSPKFKGYYFNSPAIHNQIRVLANGFKVFGISKDTINSLNAYIPSKDEQKDIADMFQLLDKKIELQSQKVEALKLYKLCIKEMLFARAVTSETKLSNVLKKWNGKNKNNQYSYVESVSNKHGFIAQNEQFDDRSVASNDKTNYYIIRKNVFAYNPSRLDVGSLALKENDVVSLVSPLYECFTTNQDVHFMYEWFNSKEFRKGTYSKFEGGVRNTLNFSNLCDIKISLPSITEQNKISQALCVFNNKIKLEEDKYKCLLELKKGLMQSMFV